MNGLTITQSYMLGALNKKELFLGNTEKMVCLVAAGLVELQQQGCVQVDDKKVRACKELPKGREYLQSLYDYIAQKEEQKLGKVVDTFCLAGSSKKFQEYFEAVGESIRLVGVVQPTEKGLIKKKTGYIASEEAVNRLVEQIRSEVLDGKQTTDDAAAVVLLLQKSNALKSHFSKQECKELKEVAKEQFHSPQGKLVKYVLDWADTYMAALAVAATCGAGI